jgi:hypothetical protein
LALEGARDQGAGKPLSDARRLQSVKVTATGRGPLFQSIQFFPVRGPELALREPSGIVDAAENHERTYLETFRKPFRLLFNGPVLLELGADQLERY